MKAKMLIVLMCVGSLCQGQTKVIAHKSHSGSSRTFAKAYQHNLFDMQRSNFGLPNNAPVAVLDTVIAVNDSLTVIKYRKSIACHPPFINYKDLHASDFSHHSDTLINDKLLNRKYLAASMKATGLMGRIDRFRNPMEEVVFIGLEE